MGIELEDKVKIVENLEDHEGYKGQVVEVIGYDDMGYLTVESSDGTQWYVGEEEVKLVKKGSGKHEAEIRKQSLKAKKNIEDMMKGSRYANGGNMEGWGGTSESSQDGMLIGGTNAELTSNQYGNGGGVKRKTAEEIYEEEQQNAMFNSEYAKGGAIPYALRKRVENVKNKFGIDITKEMSLQAYHWNTEKGMGGSSVGYELLPFKKNANKRDSQTVGDTAIDLGRYYSEYANGGMTSGWCYSVGGL